MRRNEWILLAWTALVFWEVGQIWMAQLVVYPLFLHVGPDDYLAYHRAYSDLIPAPVIVPGFASFLLPLAVVRWGPTVPKWMGVSLVVFGLVGLAVTVGLEIPRHTWLTTWGRDERTIAELVRYNWPRTASITLQGMVTLAMLRHRIVASSRP